jgi:hypothetical protein
MPYNSKYRRFGSTQFESVRPSSTKKNKNITPLLYENYEPFAHFRGHSVAANSPGQSGSVAVRRSQSQRFFERLKAKVRTMNSIRVYPCPLVRQSSLGDGGSEVKILRSSATGRLQSGAGASMMMRDKNHDIVPHVLDEQHTTRFRV